VGNFWFIQIPKYITRMAAWGRTRINVFRNVLALLTGALLLVLGFIFSVVVFAVIAALGLVVWGYLWWKTRELRREMHEHVSGSQVIEGESRVVEEDGMKTKNAEPDDPHRQQ